MSCAWLKLFSLFKYKWKVLAGCESQVLQGLNKCCSEYCKNDFQGTSNSLSKVKGQKTYWESKFNGSYLRFLRIEDNKKDWYLVKIWLQKKIRKKELIFVSISYLISEYIDQIYICLLKFKQSFSVFIFFKAIRILNSNRKKHSNPGGSDESMFCMWSVIPFTVVVR